MAGSYHRVLLVFVDGLGIAPAGPDNPLATVPMPAVGALLGEPLVTGVERREGELELSAIDANLGVDGLPQSATGQTTLFTGVNAAAALGRHVPALPGPRLRAILDEHGLLRRLAGEGRRVTFANPFTEGFLADLREGRRRASATTWAALSAGIPLRMVPDLVRGEAVAWDVTRESFAARAGEGVAAVPAREAGADLARLAGTQDFTLWETFLPDLAGHRRWEITPEGALRRLDGLLGGLLEARPGELTVVLTSDHGNLEEADHRRHTRNPVPLLAVGPAAAAFRDVASIADVAPRIAQVLRVGAPE